MQSTIFGGSTGITPDDIRRQREIAAVLRRGGPIRSIGDGIDAAGRGIAAGLMARSANRKEREGTEAATQRYNDLIGSMLASPQVEPVQPTAQSVTSQPLSPPDDLPREITQAAEGASPELMNAVWKQESNFNPEAVSPVGAVGTGQIMPATARDPGFGVPNIFEMARQNGIAVPDESDGTLQGLLRNDQLNRQFSTEYMNAMLRENGGDQELALASYNAGKGAVDQYGGVPPFEETQNYVRSIGAMLEGSQPAAQAAQAQPAPSQPEPANAAQQPPQGGSDIGQLLMAAQDPFMSPQQQQVIGMLLQRQMAAPDTLSAAEQARFAREDQRIAMEQQRLQLAQDKFAADTQRGGFRQATPEEAQQFGAPAGQFGPDGRFYPVRPQSGMTVYGPDGQPIMTTGDPSKVKPFTEGQSKDNVYATRAEGALETLNRYDEALTSLADRALDADPTGIARGALQSDEYQVGRAAGDEFLQAILRKDTGAAITEQEQVLYGRLYLSRPGDNPEVRAYKTEARQRALEAIKAGMSPEQIRAQEVALAKSRGINLETGEQPTQQRGRNAGRRSPDAVPEGVDPEMWSIMTPEERALWN